LTQLKKYMDLSSRIDSEALAMLSKLDVEYGKDSPVKFSYLGDYNFMNFLPKHQCEVAALLEKAGKLAKEGKKTNHLISSCKFYFILSSNNLSNYERNVEKVYPQESSTSEDRYCNYFHG
jgi:hypothetical protein